jgi:hypothetical protein
VAGPLWPILNPRRQARQWSITARRGTMPSTPAQRAGSRYGQAGRQPGQRPPLRFKSPRW